MKLTKEDLQELRFLCDRLVKTLIRSTTQMPYTVRLLARETLLALRVGRHRSTPNCRPLPSLPRAAPPGSPLRQIPGPISSFCQPNSLLRQYSIEVAIRTDIQVKYRDAYDEDLTPIIARTVILPFILPALM